MQGKPTRGSASKSKGKRIEEQERTSRGEDELHEEQDPRSTSNTTATEVAKPMPPNLRSTVQQGKDLITRIEEESASQSSNDG